MTSATRTIELPIRGMTCANCVRHVRESLLAVEGVAGVEVRLTPGGATVEIADARATPERLAEAVRAAGYEVAPPEPADGLVSLAPPAAPVSPAETPPVRVTAGIGRAHV